jgi:flavorubredoxin
MTTKDLDFRDRLPVEVREIAPRIHRLSSCIEIVQPDETLHGHVSSAFLIVGGDESLLVDAGSAPFAENVASAVRELAGPRGLQWIFPTHLEHPHAGGLRILAASFPEARIVADARDYHLYFPELMDRVRDARAGDEIDLGGGYEFTFLTAMFKDIVSTLWGYESSQRVMFVADGFGYLHRQAPDELDALVHAPAECTAFLSELPRKPSVQDAAVLNRAAMWWTHHRPIEPFFASFEETLRRYPADLIAPAHGGVIDEIEEFIPIMKAGCDIAYEMGAPAPGEPAPTSKAA